MALVLLLLTMLLSTLPPTLAPAPAPAPAPRQSRTANMLPELATEARSWVRACYLFKDVPLGKIDPHLCTHLLAFFGHITDDGELTIPDDYLDIVKQLLRMRDQQNPQLRVCLTVGASNDRFAAVAATDASRVTFAASAVRLLADLALDGLDLDWEFPAFLRPARERRDFTLLLETLSARLHAMPRRRLLSTAVGAPVTIVDASYEVARLAAAVDFASVMTYDFHFYHPLTPATGHNAPLFAAARDRGFFATLNANFSAGLWLARGLPADKLLLGIPTYGRGWRLRDPSVHGLYAPAAGPWADGSVTLADVCRLLQGNGTRQWDPFALAPYAFSGVEWLSYDDEASVAAKATLVRALDLAGAMTFELDSDDWGDVCGRGEFPLHRLIQQMLPTLE